MYCGSLVEVAPTEEMMRNIYHPYTKILLEATPTLELRTKKEKKDNFVSDVDDYLYDEVEAGCKFYPRCNLHNDGCRYQKPDLVNAGECES
jgi:oligopeptide/dipeptide ABC transporter ATP-binding protein